MNQIEQLCFDFFSSPKKNLKILSCGAGMQSSALAFMSCENKMKGIIHPLVPIYDLIIFCDLKSEPIWVYEQVNSIANACDIAGIPFVVLISDLYGDYLKNFGKSRVVSVPFWTLDENGNKGKMMRNCTFDYKISLIEKYIRYEVLGYKKYERIKDEDLKAHEMHIGFSYEEKQRCKENPHKLFVNIFPLVDLKYERKDNYAYIKEVWGIEMKASACYICPFHRNYFFKYLKENHPTDYNAVVQFDNLLEEQQPFTKIRSKLFISRSRKRISELTDEDCNDKEVFPYKDELIWNGF